MARIEPSAYKPILQYHFMVSFDQLSLSSGKTVTDNYARGTSLPKVSNNSVKLDYGNTYAWYKGKTTWEDITMRFYGLEQPDTNSIMWNYLNMHQGIEDGSDNYKDTYAFDMIVQLMSPDENPIGKFKLVNAYIENLDFGEVDWANEDILSPEITFKYDYCLWES